MAKFGIILALTLAFALLGQGVYAQGGPGLQVLQDLPFYEEAAETIVVSRTGNPNPRYILPHDYRLPKTLVPYHYEVHLRPILDPVLDTEPFEIDTAPGWVRMYVQCVEATNIVTFHSNNITIEDSSIEVKNIADETSLTIVDQSADSENQIVILTLGSAMTVGSNYSIYVRFVSQIPYSMLGMYHRTYLTPTGETKKLVLTKLEAVGARMVFPCFDEPALKATYQINIAHLEKHTTLCNMQITSQTEDFVHRGWTWDAYNTTVKMSTYLIAIIVSEFTETPAAVGIYDRPVSTWAAPHHTLANGGEYSANDTALVLKYFTELYDVEYPLPKMDSAAIPDFSSGAMEQWGLITYRDNYLLYFPGVSTENERFVISRIIAHEVAHQWFGNIVTMEWWDNLWLNEGFARFIEKVGVAETHPEFDALLFTVHTARIAAMVADAGPTTKPVHYNGDNLSGIVYDKASFLIRMMEGFLSKATFQKGVNRYLKAHLWGNAIQDNLFTQLTTAAHEDGTLSPSRTVKEIMDTWTRQTGFPLVRVGRLSGSKIFVTQERFGKTVPMIDTEVLNVNELWTLPITFATKQNPNFTDAAKIPKAWIEKSSAFSTFDVTTAENDWVVLNVDASAYFRVLYDEQLTKALKTQLDTAPGVISPATRSQILDDHLKCAFERYTSIETALDFTTFLDKEANLAVWQSFFTNFRPSYTLLNGHSKHANNFKEYLTPKLAGALNLVGLKQLPSHNGANVLVRVQLLDWACSLGLNGCMDYAKELLVEWNKAPTAANTPVPVDIRPTIYCAMVWSGGKQAKDFFFNLYKTETVKVWPNNVKPVFRNAMACASEDAVIDELLVQSLQADSDLVKEDAVELLVRMTANSVARPKVMGFLEARLPEFIDYFGTSAVQQVVAALATHWSEIDKIDQLTTFINTNAEALEPIKTDLQSALNTVENNFKWMNDFGNSMGDWFVAQNGKPSDSSALNLKSSSGILFGLVVSLIVYKIWL
jgi:aminopeptidase N